MSVRRKKIQRKTLNVDRKWFNHMLAGRKSIEGRLNNKDIHVNELIVFQYVEADDNTKKLLVNITSIVEYDTFKEFLEKEGLETTLPGVKLIADGVKVYRKYYSEEDEKKHKVMAIHFALF